MGVVLQYKIESNGALSQMSSIAGAGGELISIAVDPSGRYVYAAGFAYAGLVSQYAIESNGALNALSPAAVSTGLYSQSVTVDPSGKYVYVVNYSDATISQFVIGSNGALLSPATVSAGVGPVFVVTVPAH